MEKKISLIVFNTLYFIDRIIYKFFSKSILKWFSFFLEKNSYEKIIINNIEVNFFSPNYIIKWRINSFYTKEPETLEWIDEFSKKEKLIFWDIGANIGLYSIYAALKHTNCEIISFEPSTSNLRVLSRNIYINSLSDKIKIFSNPLQNNQNQNQFLTMNEYDFLEGHALNTFGKNINFEGKKFLPKMRYSLFGTSINYLLSNKFVEVPDYIKIDVDGIEHLILEGADKYLDNEKIKSILVEVNENYKVQFESIINLMKKKNFNKIEKRQGESESKLRSDSNFSKTFNYIFKRK